ncbi:MAG: response regulator transcription factor [Anaerolineae bacterium]|nr:response regulator transcription factor [Anaerolineae bacterium]MCA9890062.1 response regulator transcription factor [Anaerolineae bacterium]MCA9892040.1 response regulator transcription factor [Anaerolineae bacterium]
MQTRKQHVMESQSLEKSLETHFGSCLRFCNVVELGHMLAERTIIITLKLRRDTLLPRSNVAVETCLSPREVEVINLIAHGHSSKQIALNICISESTVDTHIRRALAKTNTCSRAHLVFYATKAGLIA